jgi:hypothetical protein
MKKINIFLVTTLLAKRVTTKFCIISFILLQFWSNEPNSSIVVFVSGQSQVSTTSCYMCNNDPLASISNTNVVIDLSYFNIGVPSATCQQIFDQLQQGAAVTSTQCIQLTTDPEAIRLLQIPCGCSNINTARAAAATTTTTTTAVVASTASVSVTISPTPAPTDDVQTIVCYLCNGIPDATITNPTAAIDLSPLGEPNEFFPCNVLYQAGLDGQAFLQEECDLMSIDSEFLFQFRYLYLYQFLHRCQSHCRHRYRYPLFQ